jgi:uncharacterized protein (DUF1501 family)
MAHTRREFLRRTGCALTGAAIASSLEQFSLINAFAQSGVADYKALVCIFLSGGNDGNNMIVPYDDYNAPGGYGAVRTAAGLAISQASILQVKAPSHQNRTFGFHPNMPEMQALYNTNRLAVLCNVGTLVQPLTRSIYLNNPNARPYQLFSHSDQVNQQQSSISNAPAQTGWAGRTSDTLLGINGTAPLPMIISTAGSSLFATGLSTQPLTVAPAPTALNQVLVLSMSGTTAEVNARRLAFDAIRTADNNGALVKASNDTYTQALLASAALSQDPTPTVTFPATTLGNQLRQVAKLIKANLTQSALGLKRQIFFCSLGGFDNHANQRGAGGGTQDSLLTQVSQAMKAFYDETVQLGVASQVLTFTLSDFGRTFQPAGTGAGVGSDHAWGNHQLIMGDAVRGGDFYGTYPTLALSGPDDTDSRGRWIPSTSVDQYAATLASWYGLSSADVRTVFPFLGRFTTSNLGFLM